MSDYRSYDGTDNGRPGRDLGAVDRPLLDLDMPPVPFDPDRRPNPRRVSTETCTELHATEDPFGRTEMVWVWGQFLDHELDLIETDPAELAPVAVPADDPRVEFRGTTMTVQRSKRSDGALPNRHTAYVDASNVYGTSQTDATRLRRGQDGLLRWSEDRPGEELLPLAEGDRYEYVAGDGRVNEHCALIAMHTVWLREHNRLCRVLAEHYGVSGDDELFERARLLVGAQMQVITYTEFLPALLGPDVLRPWHDFDPEVDPGISTLFATAGYRLGHSMVGNDLLLGDGTRPLELRDAFFAPGLVHNAGIEPFLGHLARRPMRAVDTQIADGLREHLFPDQATRRLELRDLAAMNIQRGRDHELPSFNTARTHFGLAPIDTFGELTSDSSVVCKLTELYGDPDSCDIWVGALAEQAKSPRRLGDLLTEILVDQFTRLRDGDAHWWQCDPNLSPHERDWVARRRLADVLRENTSGLTFPDDVFHL